MTYTKENRDKWLQTIEFSEKDLGELPLEKAELCLVASCGAMGEAGRVSVYCRENGKLIHYHGNAKSGFKLGENGFSPFYLGAGNFLYIKPELYEAFKKATENMRPAEIYSGLSELIADL